MYLGGGHPTDDDVGGSAWQFLGQHQRRVAILPGKRKLDKDIVQDNALVGSFKYFQGGFPEEVLQAAIT